jgi:hypothetical protein
MHRLFLACALCALPTVASAMPITLNSFDAGWYTLSGLHDPENDNYFVGDPTSNSAEPVFRNFFVFDLGSLSGAYSAAVLRVWNPGLPSGEVDGFGSPDPTETYVLRDVTTNIASVLDGTAGLAAFADLADGVLFASYTASLADNNSFVEIALNAAGLAALNSNLSGLFALGGSISTLNDDTRDSERLFAGTASTQPGNPVNRVSLVLTPIAVSEPGALALLLGGMLALASKRRYMKVDAASTPKNA